ncbi:restriction endonuclease subunit S [Cyanobium sp. ATX 6A2]|nr:restriction endonuclease subunit S [Cyanobium sp. ATX 6A2]
MPLGDLCDPNRGITYGIVKVGEFVAGGVPVIRGGDIRGGMIEYDDAKRVSQKVSSQFERTVLRGGEILINLISEPGHTAIVSPELAGANVSRDVGVIALNDEVDHRFVDYCLKSPHSIQWLSSRLQGSVTQKINLGTLRQLLIPIPPIAQQRAIAHILATLDDKIDLNRRINETLEAISQAIFRSWFVDFGPVYAKASGEPPESICRRLRLTPELLALFPDRFIDSELGEIPEGWNVRPLDTIADYLNGLALQKFPPESDTEWLPVIKIAQLKGGSTVGAARASQRLDPAYVVDDGDVLFSWSGSLEVDVWCGGRGALNQHLFKVTSKSFPKWFFFYWTKEHLENFRSIAAGKAVTMGHIQRKHLTEALCVVPTNPLLEAANEIVTQIFEALIGNRQQTRALAVTRDTLLPKLLVGELRVPEGLGT